MEVVDYKLITSNFRGFQSFEYFFLLVIMITCDYFRFLYQYLSFFWVFFFLDSILHVKEKNSEFLKKEIILTPKYHFYKLFQYNFLSVTFKFEEVIVCMCSLTFEIFSNHLFELCQYLCVSRKKKNIDLSIK